MALIKHVPNILTCLNLVSGGLAITCAFADQFDKALIFIVISAVFDFLDGFAARLFHAYSEIGKELDSLADAVSFGLAPSLILYNYLNGFLTLEPYVRYIPLVLAAFSALRLAKFNLDTRQTDSFLGLPVPASALFSASFVAFCCRYPNVTNPFLANNYTVPVLSILLSLLLISEIPMFSLKIRSLKWKENAERFAFLITTIPVAATILYFRIHWTGIVLSIFALYIVWNISTWLFGKLSH